MQGRTVNILNGDTLRPFGDGFSGTEMIGGANALVDVADSRTEQFGQSIAYPYNVYKIYNPNSCTEVREVGIIKLLPLLLRGSTMHAT